MEVGVGALSHKPSKREPQVTLQSIQAVCEEPREAVCCVVGGTGACPARFPSTRATVEIDKGQKFIMCPVYIQGAPTQLIQQQYPS
jgi:hypothetical protein